ncbi:MAG TPA: NADH-quinone oxidoreductase subunit M [Bacillota bacterium]|nr:NADH-quinone oxidoreductase subunit M [Bacillota bacterium]
MLLAFIFVPFIGAAMMPIVRKIRPKFAIILPVLALLFQIATTIWAGFSNFLPKPGLRISHWLLNQKLFLSIDGLSLIVLISIGLVALVAVLASTGFAIDDDRRPGFYALILLAVTGMNGLVMATDLFSLYVFLEIASVCSFILIAYQYEDQGIEASFKYMMLSAVATVFLLLGMSALFAVSGGVSFRVLAVGVRTGNLPIKIGMAFIFFAFALKAGMIPFHAWLPDAYTGAPAPVSVLLGGIVTKVVGVYTMMRIALSVFGFNYTFSMLLLTIGAVSVTLGAFMAMGQNDFKRMLAFSSISQIGYIMMGIASGNAIGIIGAVFHFFNHSIFKSLLFLNSSAVEQATGKRNLDALGGLSNKMPVTGTTSVIALLSTAGIPPLAGFWSKLLIIIGLWTGENYFLAGVAIFTSVVTLAYLILLQRSVFFGKLREGLETIKEVAPAIYIPEILMASITIAVGVLFPIFYQKLLLPVNTLIATLIK